MIEKREDDVDAGADHRSSAPGGDVLLVEDNPADARLVRDGFERLGREVTVVRTGERALELLESVDDRWRPRVVLLDLALPRRSGLEVLREIDDDLAVPVVVFSNSRADADVREAYRADANAFVTKPADLDEFEAVIEAIDGFWLESARTPL